MARGRKLETLDDYKRALKGKYGVGEKANYKPWLRVQDVKSHGTRSQIWGKKTGRVHHTLSSIETQFFYISEFCDSVVDIREQFPLFPLNNSEKIARLLDIEHPFVPKTRTPNVFTTDFLLTRLVNGQLVYEAISVKPADELTDLRVLEKLEIERIWWESLGVRFFIFTGNENTAIYSRNISWVTAPYRSSKAPFSEATIELALSYLSEGKIFVKEICNDLLGAAGIENVEPLDLLRYLIAEKFVVVDMSELLEESSLLEILKVSKLSSQVPSGYR
ncbi:MAG: heteromeric transposase endonuclease subunit TnsA [Alishewanella sp. 34-51-39]|nr:MAG: heteromeric transposase endonuclease subunit TnsA [Alishewanella sp. 34-51-39]